MPPIGPLERLFDTPVKIEQRQRELDAEVRGVEQEDGDPPTFRCRICGIEAAEPRFCHHCLAETMEAGGRTAPRLAAAGERGFTGPDARHCGVTAQ
jgi:hypothetical protein